MVGWWYGVMVVGLGGCMVVCGELWCGGGVVHWWWGEEIVW